MAVLVMDTATEALAAAVGKQEEILGSTMFRVPRGHSRLLQPAIQHLLSNAGLQPNDISLIGVGVGPGSYTGVRLGVSTAKAMATALCVPLVRIPTLAAIAAAAVATRTPVPTLVVPLLFARRGRAFGAMYEKHQDEWSCRESCVVQPVEQWTEAIRRQVKENPDIQVQIVHDFAPNHGVLATLDELTFARLVHLKQVASNLGAALLEIAVSNRFEPVSGKDVHGVVPEYALEVEAEVQLRERRLASHD